MPELTERQKAMDLALKRLGRKEYSSAEMRSYLLRKGFSEEAVGEALRDLLRGGMIDDKRYARAMTRAQLNRGKGPIYVLNKLKQKGVKPELADVREWIGEMTDKSDLERAKEIVERRYPAFREDRNEAARAYQALLRRGFSHEIARLAVFS